MQNKLLNLKSFNYSIFPILLIFLILSCNKPTPPIDDKPKPGKRDYTWTIDTLAYPGSFQTLMYDIWASSPTNVYVVGHNDQGGQGTMFRFDGNKWRAVDLGYIIIGGISLSSIHGFGPNDIYAVGERIYDNPTPPPNFLDSSLIIHFDGVSWSEKPIKRKRGLVTIHGSNSSSIVAAGSGNTMFYLKGDKWESIESVFSPSYGYYSFTGVANLSENNTFLTSLWLKEDTMICYLFHFNGQSISIMDSFYYYTQSQGIKYLWGSKLFVSSKGELYSTAPGLFKYSNGQWYKLYDNDQNIISVYVYSDNHIFACSQYNELIHFNGSDWYLYNEFKNINVNFCDVWANDKEVFVIGSHFDGNKYVTLVFHGK